MSQSWVFVYIVVLGIWLVIILSFLLIGMNRKKPQDLSVGAFMLGSWFMSVIKFIGDVLKDKNKKKQKRIILPDEKDDKSRKSG